MPRTSTLTVSLSRRHRKLVEAEVEAGRQASPSDVVREGLVLYERERERAETLERLRAAIAVGTAEIERGDVVDGRRAMDRIKAKLARTRKRRA